jgi:hypothetical protein
MYIFKHYAFLIKFCVYLWSPPLSPAVQLCHLSAAEHLDAVEEHKFALFLRSVDSLFLIQDVLNSILYEPSLYAKSVNNRFLKYGFNHHNS